MVHFQTQKEIKEGNEEATKWLLHKLQEEKRRPLRMPEIASVAIKEQKGFSNMNIFTAVDNLIKEGKARSIILMGNDEWALEFIKGDS